MNQTNLCLSDHDLFELQHGRLSTSEVELLETHVDSCARCVEVLDSIHLDPQWTRHIHPVLQAKYNDLSFAGDLSDDSPQESVLNLLSPSDDPAMMGRVGTYEVVGIVGQGGMGVVFKAFDTSLNRFVAIKMLLPHLTANGAARRRFLREAQGAAAVVDDHVLPIFGVDEWQGTPYLVMRYSPGQTLQQRIQAQGPMDVKEVLRIGLHAARGLAAAHAQGLVHRDVKPSNILLDGSVDRAVLTDFGLARAADDASITRTGMISGTPQYMSPEQVRADSTDARSDLFSLGSVMYAMCAGHAPFRGKSAYNVMHRITHEEPAPICEVNSDIPCWLRVIVERLMSKSAEGRFETANEVAGLLESCLAHVQDPTRTKLPDSLTVALTRASFGGRSWRQWLAVACIGFVLLLAGILLTLELNKGRLFIECDADDVPIRIMQGATEVDTLNVSKEGATIRIAAGQYRVELAGRFDKFEVENETIRLMRRGIEVVKIGLHKPSGVHDSHGAETALKNFDEFSESPPITPAAAHNTDTEEKPVVPWSSKPDPNSPVVTVNDITKAKWGDGNALDIAKRVFAARRELLDSIQLRYREFDPSPETAEGASKLRRGQKVDAISQMIPSFAELKADRKQSVQDVVTIGFTGSTIYVRDPLTKKGESVTGGIYDGKRFTRLTGESLVPTGQDFGHQFLDATLPLRSAGLIAISKNAVLHIDELLASDPNASARWILREGGSYSNPRPWHPGCDRMLMVQFETTDSWDLPALATYVLGPGRDYWPLWYQVRSQFGSRAFRVESHVQQVIEGNRIYFPHRIVEDDSGTLFESENGIEVTDWMIGKPVSAQTMFGADTVSDSPDDETDRDQLQPKSSK